jgi:hypothetical protein
MWTLTTALFRTQGNADAARATIPLIFIFFFFYDIAYTPMLVAYTLEILPFSIRAKGFAVMVCANGISREYPTLITLIRTAEYYGVPYARFQSVRKPVGAGCA